MNVKLELTEAQARAVLWAIGNFTSGDNADCGTAKRKAALMRTEDKVFKAIRKAEDEELVAILTKKKGQAAK